MEDVLNQTFDKILDQSLVNEDPFQEQNLNNSVYTCFQQDAANQLDSANKKNITIFEMYEHVNTTCQLSRYCSGCQAQFESIDELQKHYKLDCEHVKIQCSECQIHLKRIDFRNFSKHKCALILYKDQLDNIEKNQKAAVEEALQKHIE